MNEYDLKTYTYGPLSGEKPKSMVILFHGLGSDGKDLISLAPLYATRLKDTIFVSPDAPFPCDMSPLGYQWFSLADKADHAVLAGVQRAAPIVDHYISSMLEKYDVPADRTALAGFSQGGMMALYTGPRFPDKLAGILSYSGALVGADALDQQGVQKIPVHLVHGDMDDVVPVQNFYQAQEALKSNSFAISGEVTQGLGHSIDEKGVQSGLSFLELILR
jgi:phospholipase/carboxylesterase